MAKGSSVERLIELLGKDLQLTSREISEIIWLALERRKNPEDEVEQTEDDSPPPEPINKTPVSTQAPSQEPLISEPIGEIVPKTGHQSSHLSPNVLPIKVPDAAVIRHPLDLARALLPLALMGQMADDSEKILNEIATAEKTAKQSIPGKLLPVPVFESVKKPYFDLLLVIDGSESMIFWRGVTDELKKVLKHYGIFRNVIYGKIKPKKDTNEAEFELCLGKRERVCDPKEFIDSGGHRLIFVVSDCVTDYWHNGKMLEVLKLWSKSHNLAIVQMLPDWLWLRTGLGLGALVKFASLNPPHTSQDLSIKQVLIWTGIDLDKGVKIPVIALEAKIMRSWSSLVMGKGAARSIGFVFDSNSLTSDSPDSQTLLEPLNPEERVQRFWVSASPSARKLARLLVAAPIITLPIVRIIQHTLLPRSHTYQIAEVFLGGLLKPLTAITPEVHPDRVLFVFVDERIRDIILDGVPMTDSITVLDAVSRHVARRLNKSLREFSALLRKPNPDQEQIQDGIDLKAFALVQAKVLKRLGGDYTRFAEEIEREWQPSPTEKPTPLPIFTAETVYVDRRGKEVTRETINIPYYDETLTREIEPIRMMAIPQGEFWMGSPESEEGRFDDESPQHLVKIPAFFMSQTPITQAQWRAVSEAAPSAYASLPEEGRRLEPDPSGFKGDDLPVEQVTWQDAIEFCARLSRATGRKYRLPNEAEWEYACRAIPNPLVKESKPFHFGETLTSNLANYDGTEIYQQEAKGEYKKKTTPVRSFSPNAFGLYDMHGNVWEWCLDPWHGNYEGAPEDGKVWDEKNNDNRYHNILDNINVLIEDDRTHVLRGGSWYLDPLDCRSAYRVNYDSGYSYVGFRLALSFQDSSPLHS